MAAALRIHLPAPLNTTNFADHWKRFKTQWMNYLKAAKLDREANDCQMTAFFLCIGLDAYEIFAAMQFLQQENNEDHAKLLDTF